MKIDDALAKTLPKEVVIFPVLFKVNAIQVLNVYSKTGEQPSWMGPPIENGTKWLVNETLYITPGKIDTPFCSIDGSLQQPRGQTAGRNRLQ